MTSQKLASWHDFDALVVRIPHECIVDRSIGSCDLIIKRFLWYHSAFGVVVGRIAAFWRVFGSGWVANRRMGGSDRRGKGGNDGKIIVLVNFRIVSASMPLMLSLLDVAKKTGLKN